MDKIATCHYILSTLTEFVPYEMFMIDMQNYQWFSWPVQGFEPITLQFKNSPPTLIMQIAHILCYLFLVCIITCRWHYHCIYYYWLCHYKIVVTFLSINQQNSNLLCQDVSCTLCTCATNDLFDKEVNILLNLTPYATNPLFFTVIATLK